MTTLTRWKPFICIFWVESLLNISGIWTRREFNWVEAKRTQARSTSIWKTRSRNTGSKVTILNSLQFLNVSQLLVMPFHLRFACKMVLSQTYTLWMTINQEGVCTDVLSHTSYMKQWWHKVFIHLSDSGWKDTYSGLKNHCNVWGFWTECNATLDIVKIMLSASEVK